MADRTLTVKILGDDRDLKRAFSSSERSAKAFGGRMDSVNQATRGALSGFGSKSSLLFGSGAFVSTAALSAALAKSITAASDLNEQLSRTQVILGESAQETITWSQTTAQSFGISQRAALAASATFAGLFQTVGVGREEAGEFSRSLVELAADLASLQNSSPEDALIALRSGLIGEAEPLRRFNIFLSEARVQQEAMAATGKTNAKALSDQEKALARYNIILRDSAPAQGNFALTQGELANQGRKLRANVDDLAATYGNVLIPVLTDAAEAANLLFLALDKFRGVDFSPGFTFPDPPDWLRALALTPLSPAGALALGIKRAFEDQEAPTLGRPPGTLGGLASAAADRAAEQDTEVKRAKRDLERSRKQFAEFVSGLGLKLDKAGLTADLNNDIAVLREMERAILRQIEREGRTFKLVDQLTQVRLQLSSTIAQRADDAAQAASDAFNATLASFSLKLDAAQATKSFADDVAVLRKTEQAILQRIAQEGRTTDLLQRLFDVRQQQADVQKQIAERDRETRRGRQFEAIGLTAEGDERAPGAGALRRRLGTLQEQIKGTVLDTEKTRSQLRRIANVLSGDFGKLGREVRGAILQMFRDINDALDEKGGPKRRKANLDAMLRGLGLSPDELKELRARLSQISAGGTVPGQGFGAFGFPVTPGGGGGRGDVIINGNVLVNANDKDAFLRSMQKGARRGKIGRRGVGAGVGLGLG